MLMDNETPGHNQGGNDDGTKANAYRVDDDKNLEEKDLKTRYLFGESKMRDTSEPGMEGQGMGGHQFGENNLTPAGNDEGNPSRLAGDDNAYMNRTQPAEEHPEDSNFVAKDQEGAPGKDIESSGMQSTAPSPENGSSPNPQTPYRQGTADDDGYTRPEREHIET